MLRMSVKIVSRPTKGKRGPFNYKKHGSKALSLNKTFSGEAEILSCLFLNHTSMTVCLAKWADACEPSEYGWVEKHTT